MGQFNRRKTDHYRKSLNKRIAIYMICMSALRNRRGCRTGNEYGWLYTHRGPLGWARYRSSRINNIWGCRFLSHPCICTNIHGCSSYWTSGIGRKEAVWFKIEIYFLILSLLPGRVLNTRDLSEITPDALSLRICGATSSVLCRNWSTTIFSSFLLSTLCPFPTPGHVEL